MNEYIKVPLSLLWGHVLTIILTLVFMWPFGWLIKKDSGIFIYSCFTFLVYWFIIYSDVWEIAKKDNRTFSTTKSYKTKGLVFGIIPLIVNTVFMALFFIAKSGVFNFDIMNFIYRLWMSMFLGIFEQYGKTSSWVFAVVVLILPLASFLGYLAGMYKFSIQDKIGIFIRKITTEKQKKQEN